MGCGYFPYHELSEEELIQVLNPAPTESGKVQVGPDIHFAPDFPFRSAAVLVPLVCLDGYWHLVFTARTETVQDHKGQVSFPGGAVEAEDADRATTALREAYEEIGLQPGDVRILGYMEDMATVSGFIVTPVVGTFSWPYPFRLSLDEVRRVFTIPLAWLAESEHWEERDFTSFNGVNRKALFYQLYDGETLWGITARITLSLIEMLTK